MDEHSIKFCHDLWGEEVLYKLLSHHYHKISHYLSAYQHSSRQYKSSISFEFHGLSRESSSLKKQRHAWKWKEKEWCFMASHVGCPSWEKRQLKLGKHYMESFKSSLGNDIPLLLMRTNTIPRVTWKKEANILLVVPIMSFSR